MKKTKAMKALLKALLASYNSYIKNKKRLDSERSSAFFDLSTFFIIRRITPSLWGKAAFYKSLYSYKRSY